jgi:sulfite reductase (NADPH) hemoprotein beta-component
MATAPTQVLTASRLRDGDVVYWQRGAWIDAFADADVFVEKTDADAALAAAQDSVKARMVVNPYLFAVRMDDGVLRAVEEREIVRSEGPSVRRDLGKQSQIITSPSRGGRERSERVGASGPTPPVPPAAERPPHQGEVKDMFDVSL